MTGWGVPRTLPYTLSWRINMKGTKFDKTAWAREYRAKNREKVNASSRANYHRNGHKWKATHNAACRRRNRAVKLEAINHYGGRCYCCGESFYLFLALDHILGSGNKERRSSGYNGGVGFYK